MYLLPVKTKKRKKSKENKRKGRKEKRKKEKKKRRKKKRRIEERRKEDNKKEEKKKRQQAILRLKNSVSPSCFSAIHIKEAACVMLRIWIRRLNKDKL